MSFPFAFAWLDALHAVRHSHTQHALLYNFHTSNLIFEEIFFLKFLSMQPRIGNPHEERGICHWFRGRMINCQHTPDDHLF
jgi:hypothetical protein